MHGFLARLDTTTLPVWQVLFGFLVCLLVAELLASWRNQ